MATEEQPHFRWYHAHDVAVVEVLTRELNDQDFATEFGGQLRELLATKPSDKFVLDFRHVEFMGSTAFAILFEFGREVRAAGGRAVACGMSHDVRLGADIVSLGAVMPIVDDEPSALAALQAGAPFEP